MNPEELYHEHQHLAKQTIYRMFNNPMGICRKHRIEFDDLLQYSRTGLFKACLSFNPQKGNKFQTHAICNIRFHIIERLNRETSLIHYSCNHKYEPNEIYSLLSMDQETNDSDKSKHTYHDVCADTNTNVELDAIGEVMSDHIWNKLTDQQKEIIELLNKGITCNQIAEMWNMTGANVRFKLKTLRIRLEKLGIYKPINNETVINRSLGRKVSIEGKVYKSITEASKELNIKDNTINGRLKSISDKFKEWQYVN